MSKISDTLKKFGERVIEEKPKAVANRGVNVTASDDGLTLFLKSCYVDSGNELMTYEDIAALLTCNVETVRQWNKNRTRKKSEHPFPSPAMSIQGSPRFRRSEILEWAKKK